MNDECKRKDCVKHLKPVHLNVCGKSGSLKCQDYLHNQTCFSRSELDILGNIIDDLLIPAHGAQ